MEPWATYLLCVVAGWVMAVVTVRVGARLGRSDSMPSIAEAFEDLETAAEKYRVVDKPYVEDKLASAEAGLRELAAEREEDDEADRTA